MMDEEFRFFFEIEVEDEIESPELEAAIDEKNMEENDIKKVEGEIVKRKQEPDITEIVEIKQEPTFFENKDGQTNIEGPPDPLSLHGSNSPKKLKPGEKTKALYLSMIRDFEKTEKNKPKKEKRFQCQFCEKKFSKKDAKDRHERVHTGGKPFQCQFCDKKFCQKDGKDRHEQVEHGGKPFQCKFCKQRFRTMSEVVKHVQVHTEEKIYHCKFCGKKFTFLSSKEKHENGHTEEKPYQCQFCEKKFTNKRNRNVHERNHTGERPYQCKFCEQKFAAQDYRRRHENYCRLLTKANQN